MTEPEQMLTPQEFAELLAIHPTTVIRKTRSGIIPAVNLGEPRKRAIYRYRPSDIAELQQQTNILYRVRRAS